MTKILLVEDDDALRKMFRITLEHMGHTVLEARNGREATTSQQREPADVMLTDIVMPEKEGLETILEFRRKYPRIKIVAMSGGGIVSPADYLKIARQMGAADVLTKPFSNEELAAVLARVFSKS